MPSHRCHSLPDELCRVVCGLLPVGNTARSRYPCLHGRAEARRMTPRHPGMGVVDQTTDLVEVEPDLLGFSKTLFV